eukprot:CAMPEP_0170550344 /NCGR_PEP_ID=MMETSP0211-20121228/8403_1 /TAXON_ID=311385 /ORGANISM="Pseudokeronopsis sp., Strain OXSARD2" /LENGTH=164 /DNA_ID=CAMNT_0010856837 /DNA_START=162 /DNA_END=653 /DNA_ORIENTATION=+
MPRTNFFRKMQQGGDTYFGQVIYVNSKVGMEELRHGIGWNVDSKGNLHQGWWLKNSLVARGRYVYGSLDDKLQRGAIAREGIHFRNCSEHEQLAHYGYMDKQYDEFDLEGKKRKVDYEFKELVKQGEQWFKLNEKVEGSTNSYSIEGCLVGYGQQTTNYYVNGN